MYNFQRKLIILASHNRSHFKSGLLTVLFIFQQRYWTSPGMAEVLLAATNSTQSDRLKQALKMAPRLLDVYFAIALHDTNDCMLVSIISLDI